MFGTRKLIIKGLTVGGRLGPPSIPLGYASLHYERAQPMTLANDLKVFNFRWQSGVQFWVAVDNLGSKAAYKMLEHYNNYVLDGDFEGAGAVVEKFKHFFPKYDMGEYFGAYYKHVRDGD